MKSNIYLLVFIFILSCSPYKKITLTASDRLTKNWHGATEQTVSNAYGAYKEKTNVTDGYIMRFDYSYLSISPLAKSGDVQVHASTQRSSPMLPPSHDTYNQRSADDSVIRRIDFYFDKSDHVQYVIAAGFPDSVYYVKRKQ
ncbi:MAG: hypothetical protein JST96_17525 [Bacteroidetes bacterium]|nr:hypothetical protein [Bacteroidota bacterium]